MTEVKAYGIWHYCSLVFHKYFFKVFSFILLVESAALVKYDCYKMKIQIYYDFYVKSLKVKSLNAINI